MPASSSLSELSHLLQVLLASEVRDEDVQSILEGIKSSNLLRCLGAREDLYMDLPAI